MKIAIAKTAGFCMGVRRAVEMALDQSNRVHEPIFTYGPLIHNPQVLRLLENKGISVLDHIPDHGSGTVLIRAHGVPPAVQERLKAVGFQVVDATCPRVIKVQTIIRKHARKGYATVIVGDEDHPEVVGLLGFAGENGFVANTLEDLEALPAFAKAIIVAQTTQNTLFYAAVEKWARDKHPHYLVFQTICDSTEKRQSEVKRLTERVEALVVVGGRDSGNTRRLAEIAGQAGKPAFHVESESELDPAEFAGLRSIGITGGASTPNWVIKRVYRTLEAQFFSRSRQLRRLGFAAERMLILTNLYVALGAGALGYACAALQRIHLFPTYLLIPLMYVLSMHILNHLIGGKADRYNEPDRAFFYQKHRNWLAAMALTSGALCLAGAFRMGAVPFGVLLLMSILGLSYNLALIPQAWSLTAGYRRIKDIPGSKTVLITLAWGIVTAVFPALAGDRGMNLATLLAFGWAAGMVFARTAFFDILDMQGDRIVGRETIPILIGEERTLALLKRLLVFLAAAVLLAAVLGIFPAWGMLLGACPLLLYRLLRAHEQGILMPGFRLELLAESQFILAGVIAFCGSLF